MSVSDQRSQREVVEAAVVEAVAKVLHDHGPMNGPATERWQDCPGGEIHGGVADRVVSTMTVLTLLDVADVAGEVPGHCSSYVWEDMGNHLKRARDCGECWFCRLTTALARIPEEVRR